MRKEYYSLTCSPSGGKRGMAEYCAGWALCKINVTLSFLVLFQWDEVNFHGLETPANVCI